MEDPIACEGDSPLNMSCEADSSLKIEAALYVLQSVANPLSPFIHHRESRDEAERQYNC